MGHSNISSQVGLLCPKSLVTTVVLRIIPYTVSEKMSALCNRTRQQIASSHEVTPESSTLRCTAIGLFVAVFDNVTAEPLSFTELLFRHFDTHKNSLFPLIMHYFRSLFWCESAL